MIEFEIMKSSYWWDLSDSGIKDDSSPEALEQKYRDCTYSECYTLYGKYFSVCAHAYAMFREGNVPETGHGLIDLSDEKKNRNALKEELYKLLFHTNYIQSCVSCTGTGRHGKVIEVAEQL